MSQTNPVHVLAPFFFKFHLNITLPYAPGFPSCLFSFCHQNPIRIFILFPAHLNFPDLIILIFGEEYKLWNCHDAVFSSLLSILPTEAQISSSARYSPTSSDYVLNYFAFSLSFFFFNLVFLSLVTSALVVLNKVAQAVTFQICIREIPVSNLWDIMFCTSTKQQAKL